MITLRKSAKTKAVASAQAGPTWYDLLGVAPSASTEEIRAAWKAAVDGLDPTDRRFRALSDAAGVLLDDTERAQYDATLPAVGTPEGGSSPEAPDAPQREPGSAAAAVGGPDVLVPRAPRRAVPFVRGWVLTGLAVIAALCLAAAVVSLTRSPGENGGAMVTVANDNTSVNTIGSDVGKPLTYNHTLQVESDGAAALAAAKTAIVPLLSYDYRDLAKNRTDAEAYMTDAYKAEYEPLFAVVAANAPSTKTVVTTNPPVDAGIVNVSAGRVQVLLFVDRPTTNKTNKKAIPYQDQATVTMAKVGDQWLVDDVTTTPAQP